VCAVDAETVRPLDQQVADERVVGGGLRGQRDHDAHVPVPAGAPEDLCRVSLEQPLALEEGIDLRPRRQIGMTCAGEESEGGDDRVEVGQHPRLEPAQGGEAPGHQPGLQVAEVATAQGEVVDQVERAGHEVLALDERPPALHGRGALLDDSGPDLQQLVQQVRRLLGSHGRCSWFRLGAHPSPACPALTLGHRADRRCATGRTALAQPGCLWQPGLHAGPIEGPHTAARPAARELARRSRPAEPARVRGPAASLQRRLPGGGEHPGLAGARAGRQARGGMAAAGRRQPAAGHSRAGLLPPVRERLQPRPPRQRRLDPRGRAIPGRPGPGAGMAVRRAGGQQRQARAGDRRRTEWAVRRLPPGPAGTPGGGPGRWRRAGRDDALRDPRLPAAPGRDGCGAGADRGPRGADDSRASGRGPRGRARRGSLRRPSSWR
jgi:hypothetical protein